MCISEKHLCDTFFVRIGTHSSAVILLSVGVPQGSLLCPPLFSIYTSVIAAIADQFGIQQQQYADDAQLVTLSTNSFPDASQCPPVLFRQSSNMVLRQSDGPQSRQVRLYPVWHITA